MLVNDVKKFKSVSKPFLTMLLQIQAPNSCGIYANASEFKLGKHSQAGY